MTENCDRECEEALRVITSLEEDIFTREEYLKHIAEVKTKLEAAIRDASSGMIKPEFVAQYIDKIMVTIIENDTAKLEIKLFTGKNAEKWFKKLNLRARSRTGHTSKKMVESYENNLKTNG